MNKHAIMAALVALGLLSGCRAATTRAAVMSQSESPVTVTLTDGSGRVVTFADIAPGTTSTFEKLPFEDLGSVIVEVRNGGTHSDTLSLSQQGDNVVTITPDGLPTLGEVRDNPDNKPFW